MSESAWPEVVAAVAVAPYPVEVLPTNPGKAELCLTALGMSARSWLGAVTEHSGGLLVDHGWLRVLGSGSGRLPDIVAEADPAAGVLVVGYDVLGGQFAWFQSQPGEPPTVHYFGPDDLGWQDLEQGYADWLHAVLSGSLTRFYETLRWPGWEGEVSGVALDEGIHTWPPPWAVEGKDLSVVSRKAIPIAELVSFHHETARQLSEPGLA
ncbi:DUF2625 family protein [Micromonospora sp. NPDC048905]|uniref:DUF2625 family protein n=1 Tax=Micromonospora sp. NPDC048905 TaxID=3155494 RepID=UPI00340B1A09